MSFSRIATGVIAATVSVSVFAIAILGSCVLTVEVGGWYDGLGRPLAEAPWMAKLLIGHDRLWAGWAWFAFDQVLFWGGLATAVALLARDRSPELQPRIDRLALERQHTERALVHAP